MSLLSKYTVNIGARFVKQENAVRRWNALAALLIIFCAIYLPAPVVAQSGLTINAHAGFDGYYKIDDWVPVQVVISLILARRYQAG